MTPRTKNRSREEDTVASDEEFRAAFEAVLRENDDVLRALAEYDVSDEPLPSGR